MRRGAGREGIETFRSAARAQGTIFGVASFTGMDREFYIQHAIESLEAACLEAASGAKTDAERQKWLLDAIAWHHIAGLVADGLGGVEEEVSPPPLSPDLRDLDDTYYRRYYR